MNLVPIWVSRSPGDFIPHLDLMLWTLSWPHLELVTLILCASPRPGDSGPHLGIIGTWLLCSTPEPHLDMMTLEPLRLTLTWLLWTHLNIT